MNRKHGVRLLGLLAVAALGIMALAASAQAVAPGYLIAKKAVGTLLATATGAQIGTGTLEIPALNEEISCTTGAIISGSIESNTDALLTLTYSGCKANSISPLEALPCLVAEPLTASGLILPTENTSNEPAILIERITTLMKITGAECTLPTDNTVTGEICLKVSTGTNDTVEPIVESDLTIQKSCKSRVALEGAEGGTITDKVLYGKQEAFLTSKVKMSLTGAHKGLTLGVSLY